MFTNQNIEFLRSQRLDSFSSPSIKDSPRRFLNFLLKNSFWEPFGGIKYFHSDRQVSNFRETVEECGIEYF
jgi:hypothetical protein